MMTTIMSFEYACGVNVCGECVICPFCKALSNQSHAVSQIPYGDFHALTDDIECVASLFIRVSTLAAIGDVSDLEIREGFADGFDLTDDQKRYLFAMRRAYEDVDFQAFDDFDPDGSIPILSRLVDLDEIETIFIAAQCPAVIFSDIEYTARLRSHYRVIDLSYGSSSLYLVMGDHECKAELAYIDDGVVHCRVGSFAVIDFPVDTVDGSVDMDVDDDDETDDDRVRSVVVFSGDDGLIRITNAFVADMLDIRNSVYEAAETTAPEIDWLSFVNRIDDTAMDTEPEAVGIDYDDGSSVDDDDDWIRAESNAFTDVILNVVGTSDYAFYDLESTLSVRVYFYFTLRRYATKEFADRSTGFYVDLVSECERPVKDVAAIARLLLQIEEYYVDHTHELMGVGNSLMSYMRYLSLLTENYDADSRLEILWFYYAACSLLLRWILLTELPDVLMTRFVEEFMNFHGEAVADLGHSLDLFSVIFPSCCRNFVGHLTFLMTCIYRYVDSTELFGSDELVRLLTLMLRRVAPVLTVANIKIYVAENSERFESRKCSPSDFLFMEMLSKCDGRTPRVYSNFVPSTMPNVREKFVRIDGLHDSLVNRMMSVQ